MEYIKKYIFVLRKQFSQSVVGDQTCNGRLHTGSLLPLYGDQQGAFYIHQQSWLVEGCFGILLVFTSHLYCDCSGPEGGSAHSSSRSVIFLRDGAAPRLYCGGEHRFPLTQSPQVSVFFGSAYLWYLWSISFA